MSTHDLGTSSQQVCVEFLRVMTSLKLVLLHLAEQRGLTFQQAIVLHTLHLHGSSLMGAVADKMHCDASNITGIIDRLVQQGLVTRHELEHDRRAKQLTLTAKGEAFVNDVMEAVPHLVGFDLLTDNEREQFNHCLQKLGIDH